MRPLSLALAVSLLPTAAPLPAQQPATLIKDAAVFDGEKMVGIRSVLVEGSTIIDADFKGKPAKGTIIFDAKGKMLMPGMIDAHVHAMQGLDTALLFGVTTQLDMFTPPQVNAEAKAKTKAGGNSDIADLYSAGWLATVPDGHGTQFGAPVPTLTTPTEADAWVAARVAEGSDYIKIVNESGETIGRPLPTLDAATTKALIDAAQKRGKLAVVHIQTLSLAENALASGANGLVHLFFDKPGDDGFAKLAKDQGVFITPTLTVFEGYAGRPGTAGLLEAPAFKGLLPQSAVETIKMQFGADRTASVDANVRATLTALTKAGVPILAGTDAGNPATFYGISMHRELELLVKAGLTPTQALTAATSAPAKAYRLADRGRIAKGMKADLLLINGDASTDILKTRNIAEVWKNGVPTAKLREARRAQVIAENSGQSTMLALPADGRMLTLSEEGGKVKMTAPFGLWSETTDAIMGGKSSVMLSSAGTAPNGQAAMLITGDVKQGAFGQWSGVSYMPTQTFSPADLSAANRIKFLARGEGAAFGLMGFSKAGGQMPAMAPFSVSAQWTEISIPFSAMRGFDASGATMLAITSLQPGPYKIEIADVRLVKE
jgi:imidazolonepropionase-like amidohydrolase